MYKFLRGGYQKYIVPFLKPRHSVYNTHKSQADGVLLEVPHFATSVYKSTKHFGLSFAYHAQKIWDDLTDNACLAISLHSFRKKLKISLQKHIHPNSYFFCSLSVALTLAMSQVNDYSFLLCLYGAPGVCLSNGDYTL